MLRLTHQNGNKVWVRPDAIIAVERYEAPKTSIELPNGAHKSHTKLYFDHGTSMVVIDDPAAIIEAMSADRVLGLTPEVNVDELATGL